MRDVDAGHAGPFAITLARARACTQLRSPSRAYLDARQAKLLYAVTYCTEIDTDATAEGRANLAMGTGVGDEDDGGRASYG